MAFLWAWLPLCCCSSRALERAREVGMRKVVGGQKRQLIVQFLTESLLMNILAAGIPLLIVALSLPYFNQLTERSLYLSLFGEPIFWASLVAILIAALGLFGLYSLPSAVSIQTLHATNKNPSESLKYE